MGLFLSLSAVIGKSEQIVEKTIKDFLETINGDIEQADIDNEDDSFSVIKEFNGNTTVLYPMFFLQWDEASMFVSAKLSTAVLSCHIHDGDLWQFVLYYNGQIITKFNPIPEYWGDVDEEVMNDWKGDAVVLAKYIPGTNPDSIANYFKHWDLDNGEEGKAYSEDEFGYGDCWQLVDFMKKLNCTYPIDDKGNATGKVYKLSVKE